MMPIFVLMLPTAKINFCAHFQYPSVGRERLRLTSFVISKTVSHLAIIIHNQCETRKHIQKYKF
jgi:hypothetical protein